MFMGLIDKAKAKPREVSNLTKQESEFIIAKLRTATYTGNEFELFYKVVKKVTDHIETL